MELARGVEKSDGAGYWDSSGSVLGLVLGDEDGPGSGFSPGKARAWDQELATLKQELSRVKKERDFLRNAAAFFTREQNQITRRFNAVAECILCN